ncbi:2Fe-2S iron-sulfur cluster-binding protein [Bradyrhizobium erythrophlei]|uniref:2Fe-2S iron-sulfur cluster-binding protein n=1 Tax=Bradyrhizobium erythrophlei TaxID=1437360 RepID=UPI001559AD07
MAGSRLQKRCGCAKDGAFTVVLQRSDKQVLVKAGQAILDALQDVGIEVSYSCMEAIRGSCETRVISGTRSPGHGALGT